MPSVQIVKRWSEKSIVFEISLGNAGNSTDGFQPLESYADLSSLDDTDGEIVRYFYSFHLTFTGFILALMRLKSTYLMLKQILTFNRVKPS